MTAVALISNQLASHHMDGIELTFAKGASACQAMRLPLAIGVQM
jgi:hypothetical protein